MKSGGSGEIFGVDEQSRLVGKTLTVRRRWSGWRRTVPLKGFRGGG